MKLFGAGVQKQAHPHHRIAALGIGCAAGGVEPGLNVPILKEYFGQPSPVLGVLTPEIVELREINLEEGRTGFRETLILIALWGK